MLTGRQVREACELLGWSRYDLQRRSSLPLHVIDRAIASAGDREATLGREIVLKDIFYRAEIELTPAGPRLREGRTTR